ncbi:MAG: hypothetical protein Q8Q01_03065 [archaeon]|nr:hypothetical protein [archaeon]
MNKKRGIFVALVVVFVVTSLFVYGSEQLFVDFEEFVFGNNDDFQYTYALGVGEVDDDRKEGCYDEPRNTVKFGVLEQVKRDGDLYVSFDHTAVDFLSGDPLYCVWENLPTNQQGCYFLSSEWDQSPGDHANMDDCAGWVIPEGKQSKIDSILVESAKERFFPVENDPKYLQQSFPSKGLNEIEKLVSGEAETDAAYGEGQNAICIFDEHKFKPEQQAFICNKRDNEYRWYICDSAHVSERTGNFLPLKINIEGADSGPSENTPVGCTETQVEIQGSDGYYCLEKDKPMYVSADINEATNGYFCMEDEGEYSWEERELKCDDPGVDCGILQSVCESDTNNFDWDDGGKCCGDNGLDDLNITANGARSICLYNEPLFVGSQGSDLKQSLGSAWSCENDWCWVEADNIDAQFKVLTSKRLGEKPQDIVSNTGEWVTCEEEGTLPVTRNFLDEYVDPNVPFQSITNRFYCFDDGSRMNWVECADFQDSAENVNTIKGRYPGEALNSFFLGPVEIDPENNAKKTGGIKYSGGGIINIFPGREYKFYYGEDYTFDFSGYKYLELMIKFVNEDNQEPLKEEDLSLPVDVRLQIQSGDVDVFNQPLLGYITHGPIFSEDGWMHVKVPIDEYKGVTAIIIQSTNIDNGIAVQNMFLSGDKPTKVCSGEDFPSLPDDLEATGSWIDNLDYAKSGVSSVQMCTSLFGPNAWLGEDVPVADRMCCGNQEGEYYAGISAVQATDNGDEYYGCWNSQPVKSGDTIMDVQFEVSSMDLQPVVEYEEFAVVSGNIILEYDFEDLKSIRLGLVQGQTWFNTARVVSFSKSEEEYTYLLEGTDNENNRVVSPFVVRRPSVINVPFSENIPSGNYLNQKLALILGSSADFTARSGATPGVILHFKPVGASLEFLEDEEPSGAGLLNSKNLEFGPALDFEDINEISLYAHVSPKSIPQDGPIPSTRTIKIKNYTCVADECLYPLPGEPTYFIKNPYPYLYELYFLEEKEDGGTKETLITSEQQAWRNPGMLKVKKISQQILYVNEGEESDNPIAFYGCQAPSFVEQRVRQAGLDNQEFKNTDYCSVQGDKTKDRIFYCSPSMDLPSLEEEGIERERFKIVNSWSNANIKEVGYQNPNKIISDFGVQERVLKNLEEAPNSVILPENINWNTSVLPGRNFLSNAIFETSGAKELPHWEIFKDGVLVNDGEDNEKKHIPESDDVSANTLILRAGEILRSERIPVPRLVNKDPEQPVILSFTSSGTCQENVAIKLINKNGEEVGDAGNLNSIKVADASYLVVEITGACSIKEPMLQLLDTLGPVDYSFQQPVGSENLGRAGLACCPESYCWNGQVCVEPMGQYSKLSEKVDDGRDYRCIEGEWTYQPIKVDWVKQDWGFCNEETQCFVTSSTNEGFDVSDEYTPEQFYEGKNPTCINDGSYILDHFCEEGDWTSRTKVVAQKLLEVAQNDEYVLYCTNLWGALVDTENGMQLLEGEGILSDVPSGDQDLANAIAGETNQKQTKSCFENLNAPGNLVSQEENTCVNTVCVLRYKDGGNFKTAFATTLNKPSDDPDTLFNAFNIGPREVNDRCELSEEGFVNCDLQGLELGGDLWFANDTHSLIYGKQGISINPGVIEQLVDWLRRAIGLADADNNGAPFLENIEQFRDLYLLHTSGKDVRAVHSVEYRLPPQPEEENVDAENQIDVATDGIRKDILVAEYQGFDTPVCTYVDQNNLALPTALTTEVLEDDQKLQCVIDGDVQRIQAEVNGGVPEIWAKLTGKLRVE